MQICWIWQKVRSEDDRGFQRFLDSVEYNHKDILLYETVFGQGFVSTGGLGMLCHFHIFSYAIHYWYVSELKVLIIGLCRNNKGICGKVGTKSRPKSFGCWLWNWGR